MPSAACADRPVRRDRGVARERRDGHAGADAHDVAGCGDLGHFVDAAEVDQRIRRIDLPPHIDDEIGAAGEIAAAGILRAGGDRLVDGARLRQAQACGERAHDAAFTVCASRACRRRSIIACMTRSGVTGISSRSMPMALAMALTMAGAKLASAPSLASLAPNGPLGSWLSTMKTSIGGDFDDGRHPIFQQAGVRRQAVEIARFLAQGLAHAHPDRALDLALDRQQIDGVAAIERDPNLVDAHLAGGVVDADLDHLRTIAEAHGGADGAAFVLAALRFNRRGESAAHGDGAAVDQRGLGDFVEGQARLLAAAGDAEHFADRLDVLRLGFELAGGGLGEDDLELLRRVDRRVADHEGDARGIGAVVLRRHRAVGGDHAYAVERNAERLGDRDRHHGRGALADVGGAGQAR